MKPAVPVDKLLIRQRRTVKQTEMYSEYTPNAMMLLVMRLPCKIPFVPPVVSFRSCSTSYGHVYPPVGLIGSIEYPGSCLACPFRCSMGCH